MHANTTMPFVQVPLDIWCNAPQSISKCDQQQISLTRSFSLINKVNILTLLFSKSMNLLKGSHCKTFLNK